MKLLGCFLLVILTGCSANRTYDVRGLPGPTGPTGATGAQGVGIPGEAGPAGADGIDGIGINASVTNVSLDVPCQSIGGGYFARRQNEVVRLFNSQVLCEANSVPTIAAVLDPTPQSGAYASIWITATKLALADGSASANLKILNF